MVPHAWKRGKPRQRRVEAEKKKKQILPEGFWKEPARLTPGLLQASGLQNCESLNLYRFDVPHLW